MTRFRCALPGVTLRGETRGEGHGGATPAIFLHGFGGRGADWEPIWAQLPMFLPLLRYDQRGFGQSDALTDQPYSHAADLLALLDARGIGQADLVGLSQGGAIACHFALEHPDRVRRLVLLSPALIGWEWSEQWRTLWRAVTTAARAGDMNEARSVWARHPMFVPTLTGDARAAFDAALAAYSGSHWLVDRPLPETPDTDRLAALAPPTLLITGTHDLADFHGIAALLEAGAPNLRHVSLPGAGHLVNLERPGAVAHEIASFLA